jgi:uncharacterized RDD family membrane protein YckC
MTDADIFTDLLIAKWSERFIAWLIDFLIISTICTVVFAITLGSFNFELYQNAMFAEGMNYFPVSLLFFAYWVISEYKGGQSIGKKIINLKITNLQGGNPSLTGVVVSSFGKSFLLPIDMILGLIFTNQKRQRIFNKIGDTIVLKIKEKNDTTQNIRYQKD